MDSGALEPGETLDDEFDMEKEFLPEELIWLMDEMLNREVCYSALRAFLLLTLDEGRLVDGLSTLPNTVHFCSY